MNMDGEGISDVQDWIRGKLVRQGVVKPTKEEEAQLMQEMQNQQPDPQAEYLKAAAAQAVADAKNKETASVLNIARAKHEQADTAKVLSDINEQHVDTAIKISDHIAPIDSKN
jgi:hypothetical protein